MNIYTVSFQIISWCHKEKIKWRKTLMTFVNFNLCPFTPLPCSWSVVRMLALVDSVCYFCFYHTLDWFPVEHLQTVFWKGYWKRRNKLDKLHYRSRMKNKRYHTARTFPKSNRKMVERSKIYTPNTQIQDCLLSWFGTGTFIKNKAGLT